MFAKIFLLTALLVGVSCRHLSLPYRPASYIEDNTDLFGDDIDDLYSEHEFESVRPLYVNSRVRRQAHGVMNTNPDGTANIMAKLPLAGNDKNVLSAIGGLDAVKSGGSFGAASGGVALDNVNGHGLSLTGKHIPDFGNQLTAAGKVNLLHNDHNDFNANAFATRNFPKNPVIPNFNTVGAGVDYTYNNKLGASLSAAHTDLFKRTDYSAMANVNLFRNPTSTLDFNAGATKTISPYIPNRSWQPAFGLSFSKYF
ncbi:defense protein 3-like [Vanessa atalanta]|uniref:defense protein 3-like n=1 Tax=Vanessa atalanta TaxID=42275 RepID=UPI001FCCDE44|nr:defense protein 3-like [Vanessa atalanta]